MSTKTPTRLKVLTPPVRRTGTTVAAPQAASDVPQTPYLNLNLPPTGFPSWGPELNQNFSALDAAVGSLQRSYQGEWVNNRVYAAGQIVIFEGGVFIALSSGNINLQPDIHPEAWGPMGSAVSITYPPPGIAVSSGTGGWAPSINPATIPPFPNAGVPVSTSTAWGASIPTADVARYSAPVATFSVLRSVSNVEAAGVDTVLGGTTIVWNLRTGYGETAFINNMGGGGGAFAWYNAASFAHIDGTTVPTMTLDSSGRLFALGGLAFSSGGTPHITSDGASLLLNTTAAGAIFLNRDSGGAVVFGNGAGGLEVGRIQSNGNATFAGAIYSGGGITAAGNSSFGGAVSCNNLNTDQTGVNIAGFRLWADGGSSFIDAWQGRLLINQQMGEGSLTAITGGLTVSGACVVGGTISTGSGFFSNVPINQLGLLSMDGGGGTFYGSCVAQGFFTGGAKAFRIEHPTDPSKMLTHASLEGPELGVYYRGEAETVEGRVEVALPDYFEALTMQENRTVLLTQLYEEEDDALALLAASRVKDGKFRVRSSNPSQKFFWEVKAVRGDIGELIIEDTEENKDASPTRKKQPVVAQPIHLPAA
jgi:hypothetical protein